MSVGVYIVATSAREGLSELQCFPPELYSLHKYIYIERAPLPEGACRA